MRIRLAEVADAEAIRTIYNVEVLDSTNTFDMVPRTRRSKRPGSLSTVASTRRGGHRARPDMVGPSGPTVSSCSASVRCPPSTSARATRPPPRTPSTSTGPERGKGVGTALLAELLMLASAHGFHSVIARIAGHNETSIGLHRAAGFELVGVEREVGRKHRQWLDVVELQRLSVRTAPGAARTRARAPLVGEGRGQTGSGRSATTSSSCRGATMATAHRTMTASDHAQRVGVHQLVEQLGAAGQPDEGRHRGQAEHRVEHAAGRNRRHHNDSPGEVPGLDDRPEEHEGHHRDAERAEHARALAVAQAVDGDRPPPRQPDGPGQGEHAAQADPDADDVRRPADQQAHCRSRVPSTSARCPACRGWRSNPNRVPRRARGTPMTAMVTSPARDHRAGRAGASRRTAPPSPTPHRRCRWPRAP